MYLFNWKSDKRTTDSNKWDNTEYLIHNHPTVNIAIIYIHLYSSMIFGCFLWYCNKLAKQRFTPTIWPSEPHHFLKIDQIVDTRLVSLMCECHIWKKNTVRQVREKGKMNCFSGYRCWRRNSALMYRSTLCYHMNDFDLWSAAAWRE